ncbi:hypothetical protein [Puia sp.]|jgi:hypothetical protein|uniref:hypothetical protein n=1 Tax=Puia sp. TaxID=2045100 RepID=UPI002F4012CF
MDNKDQQSLPYRVMPTRECLTYLEAHGLTIHDDSGDRIKSKSGVVYVLPNGETILMPTNFDRDYPGIVFKDRATFLDFAAKDQFPVGEENMTWFERHCAEIRQFRVQPEFFRKTLTQTLNLRFPFRDTADIGKAFRTVQAILNSPEQKSRPWHETEQLIYSFGLGVLDYLIDVENREVRIEDGYEMYNPTAYPVAVIDGDRTDILSKATRYLSQPGDYQFEVFARNSRLIP